MLKKIKNDFQDIHYERKKAGWGLSVALGFAEFFYKNIIKCKNFLYEKDVLQEEKIACVNVVCVGNLTTGGVGKTPIVVYLANKISAANKVAIVSRGYGAKLQNKKPNIIKDFDKIYYKDGELCGDEALFCAQNTSDSVMVITCSNRKKAIELAKEKYQCKTVILDDGFSNRTIKKDKTIVVIDSKMRFGNEKLLPSGPLREPVKQIMRADTIVLVDKGDENINQAIIWAKDIANKYNKELRLCSLKPENIYNSQTKSNVCTGEKQNAIAFCAIGQPKQFFNFASKYYNLKETIAFSDHYAYSKKDIEKLKKIAKNFDTNIFITTQKDEVKFKKLIKKETSYSFNVLELGVQITDVD